MQLKISEMERVIETLEAIREKQSQMNAELAVCNAHLSEHMRRTELAEGGIKVLAEGLKPLQRHVYNVEGALKFVGVVSVLASITAALAKVFL